MYNDFELCSTGATKLVNASSQKVSCPIATLPPTRQNDLLSVLLQKKQ